MFSNVNGTKKTHKNQRWQPHTESSHSGPCSGRSTRAYAHRFDQAYAFRAGKDADLFGTYEAKCSKHQKDITGATQKTPPCYERFGSPKLCIVKWRAMGIPEIVQCAQVDRMR